MTKPKHVNCKIEDFHRRGHADVEFHMEFNSSIFNNFINYEMYLYDTNTIKRSQHQYVTKQNEILCPVLICYKLTLESRFTVISNTVPQQERKS